MARTKRLQVYARLLDEAVLPLFHHGDAEVAFQAVKACAENGLTAFEFTNRGDHSLATFTELEKRLAKEIPNVVLGIGSIVDAPTAALFIASGASFVVSPAFDEETAILCNKRKIPYFPGCGSVAEIQRAHAHGVEVIKLFPGKEVGGPGFVKAVIGPMPWVSIMPTGGVESTPESLKEWFGAGVVCIGMGSGLFKADLVKAKDFAKIGAEVKRIASLVKDIRASLK